MAEALRMRGPRRRKLRSSRTHADHHAGQLLVITDFRINALLGYLSKAASSCRDWPLMPTNSSSRRSHGRSAVIESSEAARSCASTQSTALLEFSWRGRLSDASALVKVLFEDWLPHDHNFVTGSPSVLSQNLDQLEGGRTLAIAIASVAAAVKIRPDALADRSRRNARRRRFLRVQRFQFGDQRLNDALRAWLHYGHRHRSDNPRRTECQCVHPRQPFRCRSDRRRSLVVRNKRQRGRGPIQPDACASRKRECQCPRKPDG